MTDHAPMSDSFDESEMRRRLQQAEARLESLRYAMRAQEEMSERLIAEAQATEAAKQELAATQEGLAATQVGLESTQVGLAVAQQELEAIRRELAEAQAARGWQGIGRAAKRRIRGHLPAAITSSGGDRDGNGDVEVESDEQVGREGFVDGESVAEAGQLDEAMAEAVPTPPTPQGAWTDARYQQWIAFYDTLDDDKRRSLGAQLGAVATPPLVSVILPVFNPPEMFLRSAIESVRAQLYTNWELCIADDCSTLPYVGKVLDEYAELDERIVVRKRETNGHISACSNSALELARGSWLCLMDHDDLLAEHALAVAVLALQSAPDAAILYSDEDHIDADGRRAEPYFKPDFDPLLILGQNYFSHLCMLRADLVQQVGGFREGYEGSQDWDLVLRALEHVRPDQVAHVPHVLYHWRVHSESTAWSVAAKPYVVEASRLVVHEHLERIGVEADIATIWGTSYNQVRFALPAGPPKVSVIVLPRTGERLRRCIESIRILTPYPELEVIVVDDGEFRPPMRQMLLEREGWVTVIENRADLSDSAQRNFAARAAHGDVLCFVGDDMEVLSPTWLHEIVGTLRYPGIGCVGIKVLYPDLLIRHAGYVIGIGGTVGNPHRLSAHRLGSGYAGRLVLANCPSAVSWTCLAVRKDAFDQVGGFSEEHFQGVFGDVDLCLRLSEAGWRTGWTPHAEILRHELAEDGGVLEGADAITFDRDIRYLHQRWGKWVDDDPSYNPNLSLSNEAISLAWPPRRSFA